MICRFCGNEVPDRSIFCNLCGQRLIRQTSSRAELTVPEPRQLPSGTWRIQLRKEGISITASTPDECRSQALIARRKWQVDETLGLHAPPPERLLLKDAIDNYIASKSNILSPSTIRAYKSMREHRFQRCMDWDIKDDSLNWQMAVNLEVVDVLPQSVCNAWRLITAAFKSARLAPPDVTLPKKVVSSRAFLTYEQIPLFMKAIEGKPVELGALLALSSLRASEIISLQPCDISPDGKTVSVHASRVLNSENILQRRERNKTDKSTRLVSISIPRLQTLLADASKSDSEYVFDWTTKKLHDHIDKACRSVGLPEVGIHGLRHSFASLAYHLDWKKKSTMGVGGWSNSVIVDSVYTHNTDLDDDVERMRKYYESLIS